MKLISSLEHCLDKPEAAIGGKGVWLARLFRHGISIPETFCISTKAYARFIDHRGLREKIALELHRKAFSDMRWEEIWDVSLRIRNLFLASPFPGGLEEELSKAVERYFGDTAVVIRSSAPEEDSAGLSFAGLHDSFVNVRKTKDILASIKKVWASLWSDRALLYRRELALSVERSSMAVIVQRLVAGDVSGICFTRDPFNNEQMIIEAVYGLNQGLVDGDIEPDRWFISQPDNRVVKHARPQKRAHRMLAKDESVKMEALPDSLASSPPISDHDIPALSNRMTAIHALWGAPLDIEWTMAEGKLIILQSRPVTGNRLSAEKDQRSWYLSLHRSFENLLQLHQAIANEMLPAMEEETRQWAGRTLSVLSDAELAKEIRERQARSVFWTERYWRDCIPFAHGIRLFGEIYNDIMVPADPHEFVSLLQGQNMLSMQRNNLLMQLGEMVAGSENLQSELETVPVREISSEGFREKFEKLAGQYSGYFSSLADDKSHTERLLIKVIQGYAGAEPRTNSGMAERLQLEQAFLKKAAAGCPVDPVRLLELARASYRLRDDDNIFLGRIEEQAALALTEGKRRLTAQPKDLLKKAVPGDVADLLDGRTIALRPLQEKLRGKKTEATIRTRARQLIGQPASRGVARARARVIGDPLEIADFKAGEILIVESVDPAMTFFAPMAAAIVEQRGGMLIHGAIIAREYGIPCITGISTATRHISTGDLITVDGYLGIVTVEKDAAEEEG